MKLCIIYNFAQHYRTGIFSLIDKEFDCDFLFGDSMSDVKKMDYTQLHGDVQETHTRRFFGGWYWQPKVISRLKGPYTHYILLGETRSLSTWLFCILGRLFFPSKKMYFWTHGWYGKESWAEERLKKIFYKLPNGGIFLYGNYARDLMIRKGFNSNKLFTIHNSLDYEQQLLIRSSLKESFIYKNHFKNANRNLIFVGRLTIVKKLDQILYAMTICNKRGYNFNLTFVGDGKIKKTLISLSRNLGIEHQVWFYGACYDEKQLGNMIYNSDLCVAPGNIGLTAMHSLVFGTPCVTHSDFKWQMPEFEAIKEGVTGSFFVKDDVESLADAIIDWFSDESRNRDLVRENCMKEIDEQWTPQFQIKVIKKAFLQC